MERDPRVDRTTLRRSGSNQERGVAVLLALFALAAIGYSALRLVTNANSYSRILQTYRDGTAHHTALLQSIIHKVAPQKLCDTQTLRSQAIDRILGRSQRWYVCTNGHPAFQSNQRDAPEVIAPDYGAIFTQATPCSGARTAVSRVTFDTPLAAFDCHLPQQLQLGVIALENLNVESSTLTNQQSVTDDQVDPVIIATPGSLTVQTSLTIPGRTLIVTGGDVKIALLRLNDTAQADLTILSAHGDIIVEKIVGNISLLALGRRAISVVPTSAPISPPIPKMRAVSVAGVVEAGVVED
jgi:hypothetical protein